MLIRFLIFSLVAMAAFPVFAAHESDSMTETVTTTHTSTTTVTYEDGPISPVAGGSCVTSHYGERRLPRRGWHFHSGVDFRARVGTKLVAMDDATVVSLGKYRACGLYVEILLDDGNFAHYCHMSKLAKLKRGQRVAKGQVIGLSGMTGSAKNQPHLHLVIKPTRGFLGGDTIDPLEYFPQAENCDAI